MAMSGDFPLHGDTDSKLIQTEWIIADLERKLTYLRNIYNLVSADNTKLFTVLEHLGFNEDLINALYEDIKAGRVDEQ